MPSTINFLFAIFATILPSVFADFWYMRSSASCGANRCQKEDYFHYYNCNGNYCDFHLQPWLFAIISFIVLSFLLSCFCTLLRFVCCSPNNRR
uniref:Uncharacterized protein n=1 Tax=Panagrolaimus sp. PS1159 TaxID=55785 RepID=A0AC35FXY5_9BILA